MTPGRCSQSSAAAAILLGDRWLISALVVGAAEILQWEAALATSFVQSLRQEVRNLEVEMERDARYLKLMRLREILSLYERREAALDGASAATEASASRGKSRPATRQPSGVRQQAERRCAEHIKGRSAPTPTRELHEMLLQKGIRIGGNQPASNLSAILSKSPLFKSAGRAGWLPADDKPARSRAPSGERRGDGAPEGGEDNSRNEESATGR